MTFGHCSLACLVVQVNAFVEHIWWNISRKVKAEGVGGHVEKSIKQCR